MSLTNKGVLNEWRFSQGRIVSGATIERGDLAAWNDGELQRWANTAGFIPAGVCDEPAEREAIRTGGSAGDMSDAGITVGHSVVYTDVTIVGAASDTEAMIGELVYATDHETLTFARPATDAYPVGYCHWKKNGDTTTTYDIYIFGMRDAILARTSKETVYMGQINTTQLEGTSAADLKKKTMWGRGKIVLLYAFPTGFDAGYVAGAQTANIEIGTTNLTGGVISLGFADLDASGDMATQISSTAITALNEFSDGDILTLELITGGTGFTAAIDNGGYEIFLDIERLPGN